MKKLLTVVGLMFAGAIGILFMGADYYGPNPFAPPPKVVHAECRIDKFEWKNSTDRGAVVNGKVTGETQRIRVIAQDRGGALIGSKVVPVDAAGNFEVAYRRPCRTGEMTIRVNCWPENRSPTDPDDEV